MKKDKIEKIYLKDYLNKLKKTEIEDILSIYDIKYDVKEKKDNLAFSVIENTQNITKTIVYALNNYKLKQVRYILKNDAIKKENVNREMISLLNNLVNLKVCVLLKDNSYKLIEEYKVEMNRLLEKKSKSLIAKIKKNTKENQVIESLSEAYGVIPTDTIYEKYIRDKKRTKNKFIKELKQMAYLSDKYKIVDENNKSLLVNKMIESNSGINESVEEKKYDYTLKELNNIHELNILKKDKAYKKLIKYLTKNFELNKRDFDNVKSNLLMNYYIYINAGGNKEDYLSNRIDDLFKLKREKDKQKLIKLVEKTYNKFPTWNL